MSQGHLTYAPHVSRQTLNAIETGRYLPSLPLAFAIARFFGRHIEEVFHDDNVPAWYALAHRITRHGREATFAPTRTLFQAIEVSPV